MKQIAKKNIWIVTAWFPSKQNPQAATFVSEQISILNKYWNEYDSTIQYCFTILNPIYPIDWFNLLFRKRKVWKDSFQYANPSIKVYQQQAVIPSHRISFGQSYFINRNLKSLWNLGLINSGAPPDILIAITLSGLVDADKMLQLNQWQCPVYLHEHSVPLSMHYKSNKRKLISVKALQHVNKVIVVAERQIAEFREIGYQGCVELLWNPAPQLFFDKPIRCNSKQMLVLATTGHLVKQKAHYKQLYALRLILERGIDAELHLIGDGPLLNELKLLAEELKITKHINFHGAKNRKDVAEIISDADLFILSSLYENCPVALIEAQAVGLACIVTQNDASEKILVNEHAVVCNPQNFEIEIADAVIRLGKSSLERKHQIRSKAINYFSEEIFAKKFMELSVVDSK